MPDQHLPEHYQRMFRAALEHHRGGRLSEAAAAYRLALEVKPDYIEALCNLGAVLHALGQPGAAIDCFRKAVELQPGDDRLQYSLGTALQADGQHPAAEAAYRFALDINPGQIEARFNLGILLRDGGRLEESAGCFSRIIEGNPRLAEAYHNLGVVYYLLGNNRDARIALKHALEIRPDQPEALNTLGNLLMHSGDCHTAAEMFRKALELAPENPKLHFNLGTALKESKSPEAALTCFETALRLDPGLNKAFAEIFRIRQTLCAWDSYRQDLEKLLLLNQASLAAGQECPIYPFDALSLPISASEQRDIAASHARTLSAKAVGLRLAITHVPFEQPKRLRIGYISPNFNNHAEAHLTASLFGLHDRSRYEVYAYSTGSDDGSSYRQRIRADCEHFIDVQLESDLAVVRRIRDDGIHILVDLAVYNTHAATGIFALRPAPVQVSYLGYPGTSGADFYDYILTDRVVTPPDQQVWYTEKFAYLPECYQVNDHELTIPDMHTDRTSWGLPQTGFVFCSFNNAYKIEPGIFTAWMRILDRVPGSVLWLLDHGEQTNANLYREAERRGIDPGRLVFAPKLAKEAHLARHRHAHLFLDTRFYGAHTTASDALRAGVPLVTIAGQTFAARVAASLLKATGLQELITTSVDEYTVLCIKMATNTEYYAEIKARLSTLAGAMPLFDTPRFARNLEQVYEQMWASAMNGMNIARPY